MDCRVHGVSKSQTWQWFSLSLSYKCIKSTHCIPYTHALLFANYGLPLVVQLVKNPPAMQETPIRSLGPRKISWGDRLPTSVFLGFPDSSAGKESTCNAGDLGSIPVLGGSPKEGKGYPFQYSGLENFMDHIVHGVAKSWTWLSDFHSLHYANFM